jgi:hypothetical protein
MFWPIASSMTSGSTCRAHRLLEVEQQVDVGIAFFKAAMKTGSAL